MTSASWQLRLLTFCMRWIVKPKLKRTGTPDVAHRSFERLAPLLFSKPKGLRVSDGALMRCVEMGDPIQDRAILYLHGGAFLAGSRRSYTPFAGRIAQRTRSRVFIADYPMLQDAPFPAASNAVLAAWEELRANGWDASNIAIMGDSAGGNLVFGLLAKLLDRGERPACVVAFSPWGDLSLSGATVQTNVDADPLIPVSRMAEVVEQYLKGAGATEPSASPILSKYQGPPPVLIQVGMNEVLRSDAETLANLTDATLEVVPHVPHVWQIFDPRLPEARTAMRRAAAFVQTSFDNADR